MAAACVMSVLLVATERTRRQRVRARRRRRCRDPKELAGGGTFGRKAVAISIEEDERSSRHSDFPPHFNGGNFLKLNLLE